MLDQVAAGQYISDGNEKSRRERIVYLAPDCTDSAVKKRAHGFLKLGHELTSFSFRRDRYNVAGLVDWPNIELGRTVEKRLLARLLLVLRAIRTILQHRRVWQTATIVYSRNLDLAILALVGKTLTFCRAPFVFEVLDIHPLLTKRGAKGAVLRWLERRVLKRCDVLAVSSPAFIKEYFQGRQRFQGRTFLLENKWADESAFATTRKLEYPLPENENGGPRWIIGWFGNLRCSRSLEILAQLAEEMPDHVAIYLRGYPSLLGDGVLQQVIENRRNMVFEGEYIAPDDLPEIYSRVHFNWCGDFSDGDNSRWLLPNRIYEGGYFGVPALAVAGHETGRVVKERNLGITFDVPYVESLKTFLLDLNHERYRTMRRKIESQPPEYFVDCDDLSRLLKSLAPTP